MVKNKYRLDQLEDAEQAARIIKSVSRGQENLLVTMTSIFLSGLEAGIRLSEQKSI